MSVRIRLTLPKMIKVLIPLVLLLALLTGTAESRHHKKKHTPTPTPKHHKHTPTPTFIPTPFITPTAQPTPILPPGTWIFYSTFATKDGELQFLHGPYPDEPTCETIREMEISQYHVDGLAADVLIPDIGECSSS